MELFKIISVLSGAVSFLWGVWIWRVAQKDKIDFTRTEAENKFELRKFELTKPFLEKQLSIYTELVSICASLVIDTNSRKDEFWKIYWGQLSLVDNADVSSAVVSFGQALEYTPDDKSELKQRAMLVANACRKSLSTSWGIEGWVDPDIALRPNELMQTSNNISID